ncbi:MAG TPA: hypothetical protein VF017_11505 [Thermoanaerobaculia bacterium]|nr:hypothetical protein [Thermoanaerobaculia bacterium]
MPRFRSPLAWLLVLAAVLAAALVSRTLRAERAGPATGEAAWIWSLDSPRLVEPAVFRLVEEVELDRAPSSATLSVLGDEQYLLYLNGFRVGGNSYRPGALLDVYDVAELLVPGLNRLVAEVRSPRGVGGLLANLVVDGRVVAVSGDGWRVYRDPSPAILTGGPLPGAGEPVRLWGRPPLGRWGRPRPGPERPIWPPPATLRSELPGALIAPPAEVLAGLKVRPETVHLFDWGRSLTGLLSLRLDQPGERPALYFVGAEPPRPAERPADGLVLTPAGAHTWSDARLRRFRYVLVLAQGGVEAVVEEAPADLAARLLPSDLEPEGLLGLTPPPRLSPMEAAVRRQLGPAL